ncbi:uncharacterized protein TEOVI_000310700 [Trypanosoma equiperdum]|uniref:T. brucei spp.-specific protein n=2 Tax=Trypanozoon TaxID=39700 RepID=Q57ZS0_TRYB2|nr:hypothetical protein Tb927.5.2010 [Trypanosoma brucei brucei TREU927]AAX79096.1 hypothetical protein Tb927.5.2010 [Trypanosoma brucei]AAZ11316.1 hypothetical protein Tb927.5.2010 [Trypanosoma brucei brucei TREU927]SCU71526.1 hypothetical protein, conserved [Trypanosoma equiperdum]
MYVVSLKIYIYIYVYIFKRMRVSRHLVVTRSHRLVDMRVKTGADEHACAVVRAGATAYECLRPPEHVRKCVSGAGAHLCDMIMGDGARAKAFIQQHVWCVGGNTEFLQGNVSRVSCFLRKPARRRPRSGGCTLASWDHALVCVFEYACHNPDPVVLSFPKRCSVRGAGPVIYTRTCAFADGNGWGFCVCRFL